ncbi:hypothetical protein BGX38DRAFT_1254384 [Terfezia claveryi]|nr:hypothetical protein BGX38DRAFT_1254384 [Terfezia claveryi]
MEYFLGSSGLLRLGYIPAGQLFLGMGGFPYLTIFFPFVIIALLRVGFWLFLRIC